MGKKGKGKKSSADGSGDPNAQGKSCQEQSQQQQSQEVQQPKTAGRGRGRLQQEQDPAVGAPVSSVQLSADQHASQPVSQLASQPASQPAVQSQSEQQPGQGKKKKGKGQQQQQQQQSASAAQVIAQPADVRQTSTSREVTPQPQPGPAVQHADLQTEPPVQPQPGQSKKKKGKGQQQQQKQPIPPAVAPASAAVSPPVAVPPQAAAPPPSQTSQAPTAWGPKKMEHQTSPVPSEHSPSPGPAPSAWGRGQLQQQQPGEGRGRQPRTAGRGMPQQPIGRGELPPGLQAVQVGMQQMNIQGAGDQMVPPTVQQPQVQQQQQVQPSGRGPQQPQSQQRPKQQPQQQPKQQPQQQQIKQQQPKQQQPKQQLPPAAAAAVPKPQEFNLAIPNRKDLRKGGTRGQPMSVLCNHLALDINPKFEKAIHYDVSIDPDKPKRMMRPVWEAFRRKYIPNIQMAFDDVKNAYSIQNLKDNVAGEVELAEEETSKPKKYKVVIKFAAEVNLKSLFTYMASGCRTAVPQDALQCIDIVLRNASSLRFTRVGRSYFSRPPGQIVSLGDGLELWHGFFQSAVIGWKPFLNVDVAHKGFPKEQPVIDLFSEISQERIGVCPRPEDNDKIGRFMKGLKIQYEITGQPATRRTFRVNGLTKPPQTAMFVQDDKNISVYDYFATQKKYKIQYRDLPCLWVGPRDRKIYLPAELCKVLPGQVCNRKLNDIQTAAMVRNAATPPDRRKQKIMSSLRDVQFNNDPVVRAFGLRVGSDFEKVSARWLAPPALQYSERPITPARGVWRAGTFLNAQNLPSGLWTIINLDRRTRDDNLNQFARLLKDNARQLGMDIGQPEQPFVRMERFDARQFESYLNKLKSKKLVFVVVPDMPTNIYAKVKQAAELVVGCLTQCIRSKTMSRMNPATVGNILLKVNAKLNGNNHTILESHRPPCLKVPCMIMGADVTHPSPDQNDIPSVAAVTASCDPKAFRYNFSWRLQPARREIIDDLQDIVREQLMFFRNECKQIPKRLIFFRDGVSEGQFQEVMNMEVQAIRRACASLGNGDYRPPITFLVVQKRHHTRFFPTNPNESEDRNGNVRAGTVVDTEITHPTGKEYYLVSHASIQGVARPTKYRVLWDDSDMSEDELEALTYYLCHMFSRCTRSVSYPAPTYYAHLAAFRARVYLEGHHINLDNLQQEQANRIVKQEILRGLPMFFV